MSDYMCQEVGFGEREGRAMQYEEDVEEAASIVQENLKKRRGWCCLRRETGGIWQVMVMVNVPAATPKTESAPSLQQITRERKRRLADWPRSSRAARPLPQPHDDAPVRPHRRSLSIRHGLDLNLEPSLRLLQQSHRRQQVQTAAHRDGVDARRQRHASPNDRNR